MFSCVLIHFGVVAASLRLVGGGIEIPAVLALVVLILTTEERDMLPVFSFDRTEEGRDAGGFHPTCHIVLKSNPATCWIQDGNLNLGAFTEVVILVLIGGVVTSPAADAEGVAIVEGVLYATLLRDSDRVVHVCIIPSGFGECKHFSLKI